MTADFFFLSGSAKSSLINNIFEDKSLIVERDFFFWKTVPYWVCFSQGEDFKLTTDLSQKVHFSHNHAIKNGVNEALLLMLIKEALFLK